MTRAATAAGRTQLLQQSAPREIDLRSGSDYIRICQRTKEARSASPRSASRLAAGSRGPTMTRSPRSPAGRRRHSAGRSTASVRVFFVGRMGQIGASVVGQRIAAFDDESNPLSSYQRERALPQQKGGAAHAVVLFPARWVHCRVGTPPSGSPMRARLRRLMFCFQSARRSMALRFGMASAWSRNSPRSLRTVTRTGPGEQAFVSRMIRSILFSPGPRSLPS